MGANYFSVINNYNVSSNTLIRFFTPSITSRDLGVELFIGKARDQLGELVTIMVILNMYVSSE